MENERISLTPSSCRRGRPSCRCAAADGKPSEKLLISLAHSVSQLKQRTTLQTAPSLSVCGSICLTEQTKTVDHDAAANQINKRKSSLHIQPGGSLKKMGPQFTNDSGGVTLRFVSQSGPLALRRRFETCVCFPIFLFCHDVLVATESHQRTFDFKNDEIFLQKLSGK